MRKSKKSQKKTKHQDSDTSSVDSNMNPVNTSKVKSQDYEKILRYEQNIVNRNMELSDDITEFKKILVTHIENSVLNAQKRFDESIQEELECFQSSVNKTLTNIRDQHYYQQQISQDPNKYNLEKTFYYKPSLLSEMFKLNDYKTLYHMIVASLFALALNLWFQDYYEKGLIFDMETFLWCFTNPGQVAQVWVLMTSWTYLIIFLIVAIKKFNMPPQLYIPLYIIHSVILQICSCYFAFNLILGFGTKMIILCESSRMIMKTYSYLRNKVMYGIPNQYADFIPPALKRKGISEKNLNNPQITIGTVHQEFQKFSYFFFAPTLIYRDQYVKAPHRSKKIIFIDFFNFLLTIYYGFILFKTFCIEQILELREDLSFLKFILVLFKLMMPSTFSLILLFFGMLHSWLNGWAELLRFPDRTFYLDWWNSQEFGQYYRRWNIVVHEFLYYYVYLDCQKLSRGKVNRFVAQLLTFMISAIIHEVIISFALGFFYPICFILFTGPGILLIQSKSKIFQTSGFNILFWFFIYIGTSLMITLYLTEYYARYKIQDSLVFNDYGYLAYVYPRTFYLII